MKLCILYHPKSDHGLKVEHYVRDFEKIKNKHIELQSLETPEGANLAKLYGVISYPAVVATRDDGQLLKSWEGGQLPLMDELAFYSEDAVPGTTL